MVAMRCMRDGTLLRAKPSEICVVYKHKKGVSHNPVCVGLRPTELVTS